MYNKIVPQAVAKSNNEEISPQIVDEYVSRIMSNMTEDQLTDLEQSPYPYIVAIEKKVKKLLHQLRRYRLFPNLYMRKKNILIMTTKRKWCGSCLHYQILSGGTGIFQEEALQLTVL